MYIGFCKFLFCIRVPVDRGCIPEIKFILLGHLAHIGESHSRHGGVVRNVSSFA